MGPRDATRFNSNCSSNAAVTVRPGWIRNPRARGSCPAKPGLFPSATYLLLLVVFFLTQQAPCRRIRPTFPGAPLSYPTGAEKFWRHLCNIFPAGPCNASMRNVWRGELGCARIRCIRNCVQIVAHRCTACRRPWGLGCGFVPARLARIVRSGHAKAGTQFTQVSPGLGSKDGSRFFAVGLFCF
jgi:hypothetical protein